MMHDILPLLGRGALAAGIALAFVLVLRVPARRGFGAAFAYRLWLLVPAALLAMLLPAPVRPLLPALQVAPSAPLSSTTIDLRAVAGDTAAIDWQAYFLVLWIAGALILLSIFVYQQWRYMKALGALSVGDDGTLRAQADAGSPALVGLLRPRIIVPSDFASRYTPRERELVLAHERIHLVRGDAQINAFAALLRCLNWFNPLFHFAASRFRFDQEIACDAAVMSRFPEARRCYADAMLKAQLVGEPRQELRLPAGCLWPPGHPLKERIAMLKFPKLTGTRRALASATIAALILSAGYASWAAQPGKAPAGASVAADAASQGGAEASSSAKFVQAGFVVSIDGVRVGGNRGVGVQSGVPEKERWTLSFDTTKYAVAQSAQNGEVTMFNRFGDEFKMSANRGEERWEIEGAAKDLGDGTIEFNGTIWHNGTALSRPSIVAMDGAPAALRVDDTAQAGSKSFKLDLTLHKTLDALPTENLSYRRMYPPKYPAEAVRNHISGKVVLKVAVDDNGVPTSAEVASVTPEESAHALADAAIAAAMQWRYNPARKDGKPVGGEVFVPVDFVLDDGKGAMLTPKVASADANVSYRKMRPPAYPKEAIAAKVSGTLYVRAHIDAEGKVSDAYVDQAVPITALALKDSALISIKNWTFNPPTRNGQAMESDVLVPMQFRIEGEPSPSVGSAPAYPDTVRQLEMISVTGAAS